MKTLRLKYDAINWEDGILHIKTPHGNHSIHCLKGEVPGHVKRIIEGIARKHGYGTVVVDMTGSVE